MFIQRLVTITAGVPIGRRMTGGRMFLQLSHVGRISDPIYHDGALIDQALEGV